MLLTTTLENSIHFVIYDLTFIGTANGYFKFGAVFISSCWLNMIYYVCIEYLIIWVVTYT